MKISYAITVCNEFVEIQNLIPFLLKQKRHKDEIVVLYDSKNGNKSIEQFLRAKSINGEFSWHEGEFKGHFADWKNKLTSLCKGDYIYQIDADEIIDEDALKLLPSVLEANNVDVILVPRINLVKGITEEHINRWRWRKDKNNWINFPDYQWRIYKNNGKIKWKNKVHEVLEGHQSISHLPQQDEWCLIHEKTIEKQEKQNNYYDTL